MNEIRLTSEKRLRIFTGRAHPELAEGVAAELGIPITPTSAYDFANGEVFVRFEESVRGSDAFVIQSHAAPVNKQIMEQLIMVDALKRASAKRITVVTPFYGYARQDKKHRGREPISARLMADLFKTAGADRLMVVDLHTSQIQGFFDIPVDHLESNTVFYPYIENLRLDSLTFASPDVGSTNRARQYAQHFNCEMVICDKHRKRANEIASMTLIGDVTDRNVILVDDICDTAGTLCNAAKLIMDKGAKSVRAMITHPVLSGKAYENIEASLLAELVVCNTIPLKKESKKITVLSVADLFASAIRNCYEQRSISSLFVK